MHSFVYYDADKKKVQIADTEVSDAGDYIGEIAGVLDPRSPYTRYVVGSLLQNAGHGQRITGLTIAAYTPPIENQEQ